MFRELNVVPHLLPNPRPTWCGYQARGPDSATSSRPQRAPPPPPPLRPEGQQQHPRPCGPPSPRGMGSPLRGASCPSLRPGTTRPALWACSGAAGLVPPPVPVRAQVQARVARRVGLPRGALLQVPSAVSIAGTPGAMGWPALGGPPVRGRGRAGVARAVPLSTLGMVPSPAPGVLPPVVPPVVVEVVVCRVRRQAGWWLRMVGAGLGCAVGAGVIAGAGAGAGVCHHCSDASGCAYQ